MPQRWILLKFEFVKAHKIHFDHGHNTCLYSALKVVPPHDESAKPRRASECLGEHQLAASTAGSHDTTATCSVVTHIFT